MRRPKIKIQRIMVAVVFFAIALWAGRILVPEMVVRWKNCQRSALFYQRLSGLYATQAAMFRSKNLDRVAESKARAASYEKKSQKFRRALYIPWECWALGDTAEAHN
jgi:hypothetical protein